MSKTVREHVLQKQLPDQNRGLPALNLDEVQRQKVPMDWDITDVFGDILMCKYIDENDHGEVLRDGVWLRQDVTHNLWRVVEVLKTGPGCSGNISVGDKLMIPGDKGIPSVSNKGERLIFVNEERAFAKVEKKDA